VKNSVCSDVLPPLPAALAPPGLLPDPFLGFGRLLPPEARPRLSAARVAVIGVGGVGSWTVEALARCGIGRFTLVDPDTVCLSNINRQLPALHSTAGREKIEILAARIRDINPAAAVSLQPVFLTKSNAAAILADDLDFVVDAVDRMSVKALILDTCRRRGIPVATVGGSGGRLDPGRIETADLGRSGSDDLLRLVRRKLRRDHGWEGGENQVYGIEAVFSREPMMIPQKAGDAGGGANGSGCAPVRLGCDQGLGSAVFVTAVFGMVAAGVVIRNLTK